MRFAPFSKTYRRKCPDGSIKTVYKNVDDAFPLYIPGWEGSFAANAEVLSEVKTELKGEYASRIQGVLFALDELNKDLMMSFRLAYMSFKNDPCGNSDFFQREVEKLLDEQRRLRSLKLQIEGLIALAKTKPKEINLFLESFGNIVQRIGTYALPQASESEIKASREIAATMVGGNVAS